VRACITYDTLFKVQWLRLFNVQGSDAPVKAGKVL
jgi:hypothetical protein